LRVEGHELRVEDLNSGGDLKIIYAKKRFEKRTGT
jgi:hypothetical protein